MTASEPSNAKPRSFTAVETWVFDLDNTLYPHHVNLWQQVDAAHPRLYRALSRPHA